MCVRHGAPPAGHGSTFPLTPVREEKKENISKDRISVSLNNVGLIKVLFLLCNVQHMS